MAFVPGLSKSQVEKVILNYAEIAPETMQLIDDLSAQINDPNDPAAALIGRMAVAEGDIDSLESSVSSLNSVVSGKQDAVAGISSAEIGTLDGIQSSIQGQLDLKAPLSSPTISNPTLTGTVTLPNASIANNKLQNSSISINGTSVPLGGNATVIGTALPSQTNNAGKALVTNGSTLSWETVDVSNLDNPTITTGSAITLYEITGLNYLGSYGMPGSQYFRPDTEPTGMTPILDLNISGAFSVVISGSNSVFDGIWQGNAIESWAVTFYGPTPEGNFPSVPNTENFTFSIIQGDLATISPTELSYLDGLTGNVEYRLSNLTDPTINITPDEPTAVSSVTGVQIGASLTSGETSYLELSDFASSQWANSLASITNISNGYHYIQLTSEWPAGPSFLTLKILSLNFAYASPRIYVEYLGGQYTAQSGWSVDLYLFDESPIVISSTELSYLNGLTGNIESKLKFDSFSTKAGLDMGVAIVLLNNGGVFYYDVTADQYPAPGAFSAYLYYSDTESLNDHMSIGQAATFVILLKNDSNPQYINNVMGGEDPLGTLRWQGGAAPTSGSANAVDIYTFTVLKIGDNVFDVFADVAKFA